MNRPLFVSLALAAGPLFAAPSAEPAPIPPPVAQAFPRALTPQADPSSSQRVYGPSADTLIARPAAASIVAAFRKAYAAEAAPRVVVYVNRTLVETAGGLRLTERVEHFEKSADTAKTTGTNTYKAGDTAAPALADRQTVREIERLFGRALRNGGAQLADQKTAVSLLPDDGAHLVGAGAAKDRQALAQVADIAIEVLISSRSMTVPEVSGDATYTVPDIQATAIRLKDSAILGQAAASDILGKGPQAGRIARLFSAADITEATALALMEDMLTGKK